MKAGYAARRASAGVSFGGGITFRIGVRNPDRFSAVGVFSTGAHAWGVGRKAILDFAPRLFEAGGTC